MLNNPLKFQLFSDFELALAALFFYTFALVTLHTHEWMSNQEIPDSSGIARVSPEGVSTMELPWKPHEISLSCLIN